MRRENAKTSFELLRRHHPVPTRLRTVARFGLLLMFAILLLVAALSLSQQFPAGQDWTHFVRIGAYSLKSDNAAQIVRNATEDRVFGIEVDNDIPGRYESFVDPRAKLAAIRDLAQRAHAAHNHAFVYIAGLECITAQANETPHTLAKEHPDWLQRKLTGEPAIFKGGDAFWIAPGDEDVWISPYAPEWRKIYMQRVRQIASTGIDGIYVDIPYWMTHFEGWENTWASFDDYTVAEFKKQSGLDARKDLKLGDFSDANFRKWVDFRIQTFTDFMHEIDVNAKSVNPQIKTIPEIYPGIEQEAVRVGADVYSLYPVVDVIAHEYEFGNGNHMASSRNPLDWFAYQVGMHSFRAFAQGKPTWILNYSWDGDKKVDKRESMLNLAMSEIMAGANFWDAPGHSMAGSNDLATRKKIFDWIKTNEKTLYSPREPIDPVGVYFSPATRNFYADEFIRSFRGILILLLQSHRAFQVVTPRTLAGFSGKCLVFPDVRQISPDEIRLLKQYVSSGRSLIITGADSTGIGDGHKVIRFAACPGKAYETELERDFEQARPTTQAEFLSSLGQETGIEVGGVPHTVATSVAQVNGKVHVFFANFTGLRGGANPVQTPLPGATVTVHETPGAPGWFLPFLGQAIQVRGEVE